LKAAKNFTSSTDPLSPYYIQSNQICYNRRNEQKIASELKQIIYETTKENFELVTTRTTTANYISVFICNNVNRQDSKNPLNQSQSGKN